MRPYRTNCMDYNETPTIKGIVMIQDAILFTKDNADMIVAHLTDYRTVDDLLEDYNYMFETHDVLVLGRDTNSHDFANVSYVVTQSMFKANQPNIQLNDQTFIYVYSF